MPVEAWQVVAAVVAVVGAGVFAVLSFLVAAVGLTRLRNIDAVAADAVRQITRRQAEAARQVEESGEASRRQVRELFDGLLSELQAERASLDELDARLAWARDAVSTGLGDHPRTVHEAHSMARAALAAGRPGLAGAILRDAIDTHVEGSAPEWVNAEITAGDIDPNFGLDVAEAGLVQHPTSVDLLSSYAQTLSALHRFAEAEEAFRRAEANVDQLPRSWRYWVFKGDLLIKMARYDEAFDHLEAAKQFLPASAQLCREQAKARMEQGRVDEADALFREAVRREPAEDITRGAYGRFLFDQGRLEEATSELEAAIIYGGEINPSRWAAAHVILGKVHYARGNYADAAAAFRVAVRVSQDDEAKLFLAKLQVQSGAG